MTGILIVTHLFCAQLGGMEQSGVVCMEAWFAVIMLIPYESCSVT